MSRDGSLGISGGTEKMKKSVKEDTADNMILWLIDIILMPSDISNTSNW